MGASVCIYALYYNSAFPFSLLVYCCYSITRVLLGDCYNLSLSPFPALT